MDTLLQIGLSNALAAAALAVVVACVGLVWRRPALLHSLWLLVLLKLVTPPLVWVAVPWPAPAAPAVPAAEVPGTVDPVSYLTADRADEGNPPPARAADATAPPGPVQPIAAPAEAPSAGWQPPPPSWLRYWWQPLCLGIWALGSALWFACALGRLARFQRLLRHAALAPLSIQKQTQRLARKLGMNRVPAVYLVPGRVSPLLWAFLGRARLVLPADLLGQVDDEQRATLILHELAHLRRRDHWVRALEFCAMGLYWWHPVVWFVRRELRESEELCCDAWVVSSLPQANRTYATALVETVDFLSAVRAPVPLLASGVGPITDLKRRLTLIMRGTTPRTLSWRGLFVVCGLGALLLPLLPAFAQAQAKKADGSEAEALYDLYAVRPTSNEAVDPEQTRAQIASLQQQLRHKQQEIQETQAKIRKIRQQLGDPRSNDLATVYRFVYPAVGGKDAQEIMLHKVGAQWQLADPAAVTTDTYRIIDLGGSSQRPIKFGLPPTAAADNRIEDLERKLTEVLSQMETMQQELKASKRAVAPPTAQAQP